MVRKLWWLPEWLFVTPSHHRAHHESNPEYIDKNYANLLIIWDRIFGTFAHERAPVRYGLINNNTCNPLRIAFGEWSKLFWKSAGSRSFAGVCRLWLKPPGWDAVTNRDTNLDTALAVERR